jgi:hypothetical protein
MDSMIAWHSPDSGCAEPQPEKRAARQSYPGVERREKLSTREFFAEYVEKSRPVLIPGALNDCRAPSRWTPAHLRSVSGQRIVKLKEGLTDSGVTGMRTVDVRLKDYLDSLEEFEAELRKGEGTDSPAGERPAYLHDVPLVSLLPDAADDLRGFPAEYFPRWYRRDRWQFAQFFLGPTHSLTPLHFDCLLTHNLFFQVAGRKRFILLPHDQLPYCYRYRWRWCGVDAENPDYARHPLYRQAQPLECIVAPGDVLYMPPGMLHHVRSLDCAISFNIDWHTPDSALKGVLALARGMPLKNVCYNAVIAFGLCTGVPARRLLPWYRSYLNYVS